MSFESIEDRLWSRASVQALMLREWEMLVQHLIDGLRLFTQRNMVAEPVCEVLDGEAVCVRIWEEHPNGTGPLQIHYEGTLGIDPDRDPEHTVDVALFAFVEKTRLVGIDGNKDYLSLGFKRGADGRGHWEVFGWVDDEYDEFESFREPRAQQLR